MSKVAKDTMREIRDFWRQHTFQIKQEFKKDWERYLLFRLASTVMIITSAIAFCVFFVWLIYAHAMIAAIAIWSTLGLLVGGAACVFVYERIDKAVKRGL